MSIIPISRSSLIDGLLIETFCPQAVGEWQPPLAQALSQRPKNLVIGALNNRREKTTTTAQIPEFHGGQQGSTGGVTVGVGDGVAMGVAVAIGVGVGVGVGAGDGVAVGSGPHENWPPIIAGRPAVLLPDESEAPLIAKAQDVPARSGQLITLIKFFVSLATYIFLSGPN